MERAREMFGELLATADAGTVTLVVRDGWDWAAVVPYEGGPEWVGAPWLSATEAKADLGRLVRKAAAGKPQVFTRYHCPVAGLIPASKLLNVPEPDAPDPTWLLQNGFEIVLGFYPGDSADVGDDGEVYSPPIDEQFTAVVRDASGIEVAHGSGETWQEALRGLARNQIYTGEYAEPPF